MPDRIIVLGSHSVTVTHIYNKYRVWCQPCDYEEWYDRRFKADDDADMHVYGCSL